MRKLLTVIVVILFAVSISIFAISNYTGGNGQNQNNIAENATPEPQTRQTVTISAAGDVTLATDVNTQASGSFESEVAAQNDLSSFFYNVRDIFSEDDMTIVNFEGVLSDGGTRANKTFAFRGSPEYVEILTSGSVEAANLANNHTLDYGETALNDTIDTLNNANIVNFYGTNAVIKEINGVQVGLCGFNALNETGVNQAEQVIQELKNNGAQLIIASVHWGVEKATSPTEEQQTLARQMVDAGANLILGHHPHVLQGIEKYNGSYIVYSLGNFCFGGNRNPADKDTMIFRQTFTLENGTLIADDNVEIIPCSISSETSRNNYRPTPAVGEQYSRIVDKLTEYTTELGSDARLNFRAEPQV